jgi:hypothetical protein
LPAQAAERALALDPNNHDTINLMGRVAFARGDLQEAVTHFGRAIKLKPDLADAYNNMGNALKDVVAGLEGQARRILAHCGLDWDPNYLQFHRTERPVRTTSATQVRQPIYRSAIGRWCVYEPYLRPLLAELSRVGSGQPRCPRATVDSLERFSGGGKTGFPSKKSDNQKSSSVQGARLQPSFGQNSPTNPRPFASASLRCGTTPGNFRRPAPFIADSNRSSIQDRIGFASARRPNGGVRPNSVL